MLTAPGVIKRLEAIEKWPTLPTRSPTEFSLAILEHLQTFFVNTELNAAFMGMFALSLFLYLGREVRRQTQAPPIQQPFQLAAPPLLLCTLAQLALLPLVWTQQSDNPLVFGRFSPSYMFIIAANLILLLIMAAILVARGRINAVLRRKPGYWATIPALTLAVIFLVFCLANFRSIDWRAKTFVYGSVYTLLFGLYWQLHSCLQASTRFRFLAAGLSAIVALGIPVLALVGVNEFIFGYLQHYSLPFVSFAFAFSGYICGTALAFVITRAQATSPAPQSVRAIMVGSAIIAIAIWFGVMQRNIQDIPSFVDFSRRWDERHQLVLSKRDRGERLAAPPRLEAENPNVLGFLGGRNRDYWQSMCPSEEITALLEEKYRA